MRGSVGWSIGLRMATPPNDEEKSPEEKTTESPPVTPEEPEEREAKRRYRKLAEFGLPIGTYQVIKDILRAMSKLGGAGTPMSLQSIVETVSMSVPAVSGNNRFLISTGIVVKSGNSFALTSKGAQLALALDYNDADDSARAWRSIISDVEFLRKVLGSLDIKGGLPAEEYAQTIARAAGVPKEPQFVRGGQTLVDIFLDAGLVTTTEGGKVVVTPEYRALGTVPVTPESRTSSDTLVDRLKIGTQTSGNSLGLAVVVNVQLSPDTSSSEIESIAARIRELKAKLA
jgi:hypothetical protein